MFILPEETSEMASRKVSGLMKELGRMTPEERQTRGAELNRLKDEIDASLRQVESQLEAIDQEEAVRVRKA